MPSEIAKHIRKTVIKYLETRLGRVGITSHLETDALLSPILASWDKDFVQLFISGVTNGIDLDDDDITSADRISSLVVASYNACGGTGDITDFTIAVHLIYTCLGIFDDIQDQDKPLSLVGKAGVGRALNVAVMFLMLGQELINKGIAELGTTATSENPLLMPDALNKCLIAAIRGQVADLQELDLPIELKLSPTTGNYYLVKNQIKAGLIFGYITELGAFLALGDKPSVKAYRDFGVMYGSILQLFSDLGELLTNKGRRDLKNKQITLPILFALENLPNHERSKFLDMELEEAVKLLDIDHSTMRTLEQIGAFLSQAQKLLETLDPGLKNPDHIVLINDLYNFVRPLRSHFLKTITKPV